MCLPCACSAATLLRWAAFAESGGAFSTLGLSCKRGLGRLYMRVCVLAFVCVCVYARVQIKIYYLHA